MNATFSACRTWRYVLDRHWKPHQPALLVVMLNPSTADETKDDPTIRRVRGFAEAWGYGGVRILNLFALRSTDPEQLRIARDPIGPDNDRHLAANIAQWASSGLEILAAWGGHGNMRGRAFVVSRLVDEVEWICLGTNADGTPKHPLYVKADTKPIAWNP